MTTRQPTPGVHENFAAKISPEVHAAHEAGLEAAALAALGHDHLLEVMMDLPEFKDMFSRSLKAYLSASGLALTPAPVPHVRATDSFGNDLIERELVSIVLRMSRHLLAVETPAAKKLNEGALDYLRRKGLMPSPLRSEETVVQSTPAPQQKPDGTS